MSQPIYTPTFQHKDWVDFVDSVQAGGTNGINIRFHGIEAEFTAIQAAFNLVTQAPPAQPQTMTLALMLTATTNPPGSRVPRLRRRRRPPAPRRASSRRRPSASCRSTCPTGRSSSRSA